MRFIFELWSRQEYGYMRVSDCSVLVVVDFVIV